MKSYFFFFAKHKAGNINELNLNTKNFFVSVFAQPLVFRCLFCERVSLTAGV